MQRPGILLWEKFFLMEQVMNTIMIATNRPEALKSFCSELERQSGIPVTTIDKQSLLVERVKEHASPALILDGDFEGMNDFSLVKTLLSLNAMVNMAVISDLEEQTFHEITEGLGILMQLPRNPARNDAAVFWEKLKLVSGYHPT